MNSSWQCKGSQLRRYGHARVPLPPAVPAAAGYDPSPRRAPTVRKGPTVPYVPHQIPPHRWNSYSVCGGNDQRKQPRREADLGGKHETKTGSYRIVPVVRYSDERCIPVGKYRTVSNVREAKTKRNETKQAIVVSKPQKIRHNTIHHPSLPGCDGVLFDSFVSFAAGTRPQGRTNKNPLRNPPAILRTTRHY